MPIKKLVPTFYFAGVLCLLTACSTTDTTEEDGEGMEPTSSELAAVVGETQGSESTASNEGTAGNESAGETATPNAENGDSSVSEASSASPAGVVPATPAVDEQTANEMADVSDGQTAAAEVDNSQDSTSLDSMEPTGSLTDDYSNATPEETVSELASEPAGTVADSSTTDEMNTLDSMTSDTPAPMAEKQKADRPIASNTKKHRERSAQSEASTGEHVEYTIKANDTLGTIAKKVYGKASLWKGIATLNQIEDPNRIYAGKTLKLDKSLVVDSKEIASNVDSNHSITIKRGDSLSLIAKSIFGDMNAWKQIYEANKESIKDPNIIYEGQMISIPEHMESEMAH